MIFFPEVLGNAATKDRLGQAILDNLFPHAFIIEGPKGCGKHTLVLSLSAALNCNAKNNGTSLPCGSCDRCRRIMKKNFVDVKYISKKDGKSTIGVEDIRTMREDVYLSPTESEYKIYVIEDAHVMTMQAQNALLKIFEEPPAGVVIFLLCENIQQILSTIKSRAQLVRMQRLSDDVVSEAISKEPALKSIGLSNPQALTAAIKLSQGSIGYAKEMLGEEKGSIISEQRGAAQELLASLIPGPEKFKLFSAIQSLPQKRNEFSRAVAMILDGLRDLILIKYSETTKLLFYTDTDTVISLATRIGHVRLLRFYDAFSAARNKCEKNGNMSTIITELGALASHI